MVQVKCESDQVRPVFAGNKYFKVNSSLESSLLASFDLYKKVSLRGREYYVLCRKKGSLQPFPEEDSLYLLEGDMENLLKTDSPSVLSGGDKPEGRIARLLITNQFERRILDNSELDLYDKIELTVHCASQVLRGLFNKGTLERDDLDIIAGIGQNFLTFTRVILAENEAVESLLYSLASHNYEIYTHSVHVSLYSGLLAGEIQNRRLLTISPGQMKSLYIGNILHDIGKILIDPAILIKKGPLTREELEEVKKHPALGMELVKHAELPEDALKIILYHHEKWSGGGFPWNISNRQISPFARIACITDTFDTLTSRREYREGIEPFEALVMMKKKLRENFYHPYLDIFIQLLGKGSRL